MSRRRRTSIRGAWVLALVGPLIREVGQRLKGAYIP